jgi:type IV pilus assembly protein PilA
MSACYRATMQSNRPPSAPPGAYVAPNYAAQQPSAAPNPHGAGYPAGGGQGAPGYGAQGLGGQGFGAAPPPRKSNTGAVVGIVAVVIGCVLFGLVIFGTLVVYGVRKYIANAKTAEARNVLGQLSKLAADHHAATGKLRPSAGHPVPASATSIRGSKYQSTAAEWAADGPKAGFACLHFELNDPQYFRYEYEANAKGFVVRAQGDLNSDGVLSTFETKGELRGADLDLQPAIIELNPTE